MPSPDGRAANLGLGVLMNMSLEEARTEFAALLRSQPRGTTADITAHTVVCLDGEQVIGVHLSDDPPGFCAAFPLDDHFYGDAHEHLAVWLAHPIYTSRPALAAWLDDPTHRSTTTSHGD
jgi:hypothetical protein